MTEIERYMIESKSVWYNPIDLIRKFGREELNRLYVENKIEIRNGLNNKVIRLK
jgi:hypothetical protein